MNGIETGYVTWQQEERRKQRRLAQARYRQVHAKRLRMARRVAGILTRQARYARDLGELTEAIRGLVGRPYARVLGRELVRRD
jgi:hypothetical protein